MIIIEAGIVKKLIIDKTVIFSLRLCKLKGKGIHSNLHVLVFLLKEYNDQH